MEAIISLHKLQFFFKIMFACLKNIPRFKITSQIEYPLNITSPFWGSELAITPDVLTIRSEHLGGEWVINILAQSIKFSII